MLRGLWSPRDRKIFCDIVRFFFVASRTGWWLVWLGPNVDNVLHERVIVEIPWKLKHEFRQGM